MFGEIFTTEEDIETPVGEPVENIEEESAAPTDLGTTLRELQSTQEYKDSSSQDKLHLLVEATLYNILANNPDISPEDIEEIKLDKPWGGYITLNWRQDSYHEVREVDVLRKYLFVYPGTDLDPDKLSTEGEQYRDQLAHFVGPRLLMALSMQKHPLVNLGEGDIDWEHSDRLEETWRTVSGEGGFHVTTQTHEIDHSPDMNEIIARRIKASDHAVARHGGLTYHALVNTGPDMLVVEEDIYSNDKNTFAETNIVRDGDLFSREGKSENI